MNLTEIKSLKKNSKQNIISWKMTKWCNYKCRYCIQQNGKKFKKELEPDWELIKNRAHKIHKAIINYGRDTKLNLIGGEVTYFNLKELIDIMYVDNLIGLLIITNFSNSEEYYTELYKYCFNKYPKLKFRLRASLHDDYVTPSEFINKINNVINNVGNELTRKRLEVEFVVTNDNQEKAKEVIELCNKYNLKLSLDVDKTVPYTGDKELLTKSNINSINIEHFDGTIEKISRDQAVNSEYLNGGTYGLFVKGCYCYPNITIIDFDGSIKYCYKEKSKLNIDENDLILRTDIIKCDTDYCNLCYTHAVSMNKEYLDVV